MTAQPSGENLHGLTRVRPLTHRQEVPMKLSIKALAITLGLLWAGCVFLVAVLNVVWEGYGVAFLSMAASIYPGFHPGGLKEAVVGGLYALVDGAVCGALIAWVYNQVAERVGTG